MGILPSLIIGDLCLLFIYSYLQPDLYFSPVVGCAFVVAMNLIFLIWQHQQNDRRFSLIEHRFNHWSQAQVQHNEEYVEKKRREKKLIQDQRISFQNIQQSYSEYHDKCQQIIHRADILKEKQKKQGTKSKQIEEQTSALHEKQHHQQNSFLNEQKCYKDKYKHINQQIDSMKEKQCEQDITHVKEQLETMQKQYKTQYEMSTSLQQLFHT